MKVLMADELRRLLGEIFQGRGVPSIPIEDYLFDELQRLRDKGRWLKDVHPR
jgi:hypothetical protein